MAAKGGAASAAARGVAKAAREFPRSFAKPAVQAIRRDVAKTLKADLGGDSRMSGIGNARLTIKTSTQGDQTVIGTVTAGKPRGPWNWLEKGTKPHLIGRRRHPGMKGKRTWSRPAVVALDSQARRARRELMAIIRGR